MYTAILRTPGIAKLLLASVIGRLPNGAAGLLLFLRTREMTGSYAAGGLVAAANSIGYGLGSPILGRLIDRRGQTAVIPLAGLVCAAAYGVAAALPDSAPLAAMIAAAIVGGASFPPFPASQRAIWDEVMPGDLRHSMYAFESVLFEIVYIAGPLLLLGVIGAWSLQAAIAVCAIASAVGALTFAANRLSRAWRPDSERPADLWGPLRSPGVRTLLLALTMFGVAVVAIEIAVAAFGVAEGSRGAVGRMLALWGVGSMVGGLIAGRLKPPKDPGRRLAALTTGLALLNLPLVAADSVATMMALMFVAGLLVAPTLATAFALLSDVAPAGTSTEAQTWIGTAFGGGIAAGSALAGWMVDGPGVTATMLTAVVFLGFSAAIVATRLETLRVAPVRRASRPPQSEPELVPV